MYASKHSKQVELFKKTPLKTFFGEITEITLNFLIPQTLVCILAKIGGLQF